MDGASAGKVQRGSENRIMLISAQGARPLSTDENILLVESSFWETKEVG